jgi:hypothetical protein
MVLESQRIGDFIDDARSHRYYLPAIRPGLVWTTDRSGRLFDSLLRGYPIGAMVRWRVPDEHFKDLRSKGLTFYEVDWKLDARKPCGEEADLGDPPSASVRGILASRECYGILDGRQRATALAIGMRGTYVREEPRKSGKEANACPELELHINLLHGPAPGDDMKFALSFRERSRATAEGEFWFRVGDILEIRDEQGLRDYRRSSGHADSELFEDNLAALYNAVWLHSHIHFLTETGKDLDEAIRIFNRLHDLHCH